MLLQGYAMFLQLPKKSKKITVFVWPLSRSEKTSEFRSNLAHMVQQIKQEMTLISSSASRYQNICSYMILSAESWWTDPSDRHSKLNLLLKLLRWLKTRPKRAKVSFKASLSGRSSLTPTHRFSTNQTHPSQTRSSLPGNQSAANSQQVQQYCYSDSV